jgi:metallo-beta-lactamase class B
MVAPASPGAGDDIGRDYDLMNRLSRRRVVVVLGLVIVFALVLVGRRLNATKIGGQQPAEPFRIAGNFYYVGANDIAAFLITGPAGHIVLDAGYPTTATMIMASIAKLGFSIKDVKVLLNSEPHPDHGGGLAVLQQASGAQVWASEASADTLASGGDDPDLFLPMRALVWIGIVGYPPVRVDHRFEDGDTIRLGPIALTAHITAGHTRGCTSYSFQVHDGDRVLNVVCVCDTGVLEMSSYPEQAADRARSLKVLRALLADIWVTNHARAWGRYRKYVSSRTAKNPADAFIDREGYQAFLDAAEAELQSRRVH